MRKMWRKIIGTAALALMFCLTGLVMSGEAQAQRFVDNGNGTVTDTATNLMWTKDANPFGNDLRWDDAMAGCGSFSISGIGGWRLPSKDELIVLSHALSGGHPFTGFQPSSYWSSTADAVDKKYALVVYMGNGFVGYGTYEFGTYRVWPVRVGQ